MANTKSVVPFFEIIFPTTADRLAYAFTSDEVGRCVVKDMENGKTYSVIGTGAGASSTSPKGAYQKSIALPITAFKRVDGNSDVPAIAVASGNGGNLASDSTPILRGRATVNNHELSWATGDVTAIGMEVPLPNDFDGTQDVTLELVINSGTTDAATMAVATTWDGGTEVADSASDSATKSATDHTITATIDKADVPDAPKHLSIRLTPPTHGTNAIQLSGARILYIAK